VTFIPDDTAVCAQVDPEVWFPTRELHDGVPTTSTQAVALCNTCPLIDPCRDYALLNSVEGVWGGTTDRERATIRRRTGIHPTPLDGYSQTDDAIRLRNARAAA
jgi:WhiB family redox-sensing transcriptional regulator